MTDFLEFEENKKTIKTTHVSRVYSEVQNQCLSVISNLTKNTRFCPFRSLCQLDLIIPLNTKTNHENKHTHARALRAHARTHHNHHTHAHTHTYDQIHTQTHKHTVTHTYPRTQTLIHAHNNKRTKCRK